MKTWKLAAVIGVGIASLSVAVDASAQTSANGPYYATPSWDQTMPSSTRFLVLSNFNSEAVLDRETGVVWERTPSTLNTTTYAQAFTNCALTHTGGRYGWRLPTYPELTSLMEANHPQGFPIPAGHPFVLPTIVGFWSSTPSPFDGGSHFTIRTTNSGPEVGFTADNGAFSEWCVRGADR